MPVEIQKLSDETIQARLQQMAVWSVEEGVIQRTFELSTFPAAIFFVNAVAQLAELGAHHPDFVIMYNKVKLLFATHSAGGITEKDFMMAHKVDELWQTFNWVPAAPLGPE